ncbi:hypothetical protein IF1G_07078 [Cordyceps javanica]|uniref:Uncharacterized protein n=1 Tax=Cordyceps javanica TaxID=43265 RepID=A0A545UXK9_9HYPO|nr:hypothetical protein IF1G_07078 [Cordyceps javanica]
MQRLSAECFRGKARQAARQVVRFVSMLGNSDLEKGINKGKCRLATAWIQAHPQVSLRPEFSRLADRASGIPDPLSGLAAGGAIVAHHGKPRHNIERHSGAPKTRPSAPRRVGEENIIARAGYP